MSFSSGDRDRIMGYLGIPISNDQIDYIQGVLAGVEVQAESVSRVQGYLTKLAAIDTQIDVARNVMMTLTEAGSIQSPYSQLLAEGQRVVKLLSASIGVEPRTTVYLNPFR